MKNQLKSSLLLTALFSPFFLMAQQNHQTNLEVVAALDVRPGDVAVSAEGRIFSTIHPLGNTTG
ncbi:hypothetical protein [Pedobacter sp. UBA5917]|uniref:hypothetical protein n=1 Tax=Pedobacter sp. UBA5917 TaxID=1947061 RepID=UPI0025DA3954|nr:hypothetical protein [Pedobacter sp. UBA5917]